MLGWRPDLVSPRRGADGPCSPPRGDLTCGRAVSTTCWRDQPVRAARRARRDARRDRIVSASAEAGHGWLRSCAMSGTLSLGRGTRHAGRIGRGCRRGGRVVGVLAMCVLCCVWIVVVPSATPAAAAPGEDDEPIENPDLPPGAGSTSCHPRRVRLDRATPRDRRRPGRVQGVHPGAPEHRLGDGGDRVLDGRTSAAHRAPRNATTRPSPTTAIDQIFDPVHRATVRPRWQHPLGGRRSGPAATSCPAQIRFARTSRSSSPMATPTRLSATTGFPTTRATRSSLRTSTS